MPARGIRAASVTVPDATARAAPAGDADAREARVRDLDARLRRYGDSRHGNQDDPLDELVYIVLSAQTEAYSYRPAYAALAAAFPGWGGVLRASEDEIAAHIRSAGLAGKKARQIKGALAKIAADFGGLSLDALRGRADEEVERYLVSLPGIGVKSAKCIMLYAFGRAVFPVDTHVWRICRRLGLAAARPKPTPALERRLEVSIPADVRLTLHVNLVSHGQETCLTYWPKCHACVLADVCPSAFRQDAVWGRWRRPAGAWAKAVAEVSQPDAPPRAGDAPGAKMVGASGRGRPEGSTTGEERRP